MSVTQQDTQRAAFEAWLRVKPCEVVRGSAWEAWQAAIAHDRQQRGERMPYQLAKEAAKHLTNWLDMNECECEGSGHHCGRTEVQMCRDQLLGIAPQPAEQRGEPVGIAHDAGPTFPAGFTAAVFEPGKVKPGQALYVAAPQPDEPVKLQSDDERAAQGLPPYNPRLPTDEEMKRLTENGRKSWGKDDTEPVRVPSDAQRWHRARTLPRSWWQSAFNRIAAEGVTLDELIDAETKRRLP